MGKPVYLQSAKTSERYDEAWIDRDLSEQLEKLCAQGEGEHLDFKEAFPERINKLGKEIAAFATSGGGTVLIGISDAGNVVGITGAGTASERDGLIQRVEGICSNGINPSITPSVRFALGKEKMLVMAIVVPNGPQPIYYHEGRPYIRHLSSSRPAKPHEVIDLIQNWSPQAESDSPQTVFLSNLAHILTDILIIEPEIESRDTDPWLQTIKIELQSHAAALYEMVIGDIAEELNISEGLQQLAQSADAVADHRWSLDRNSYEAFLSKLSSLTVCATTLMDEHLDATGAIRRTAPEAQEHLPPLIRRLQSLANRAEAMADSNRISDLQQQASEIGNQLLRLSYLGLQYVDALDIDRFREMAHRLHLVETMRLESDGGISRQNILDTINELAEQLTALCADMPKSS